MDKIENEIVSYFLEEFGKTKLSTIRIKPILSEYKNNRDFINQELRHKILKQTSQHKFIPHFETILSVKSEYKINLVKDIEIVYVYLRKLQRNPDIDDVITTLNDIFDNVSLTKNRLFECFYYLTCAVGFVSYAPDQNNEKIVFDMDREFSINDGFSEDKSFNDYLIKVNSWNKDVNKQRPLNNQRGGLTSNQEDKILCRNRARELWDKNPNMTITDVAKTKEILKYCNGGMYKHRTIKDWIKDLSPNSKAGRPFKNN